MQYKRDENQKSNKLNFDKYYTSDITAQYCIDTARKVLKNEKITEVIEPSAGNGVFSKKIKNCIAYDIEPDDESVIKQDFLELEIEYKKGRLFIGNPPFGARNTLAVQFYKKCIQLGDYIAFILPISQLNNTQQMYEFDLIYSEDLGKLSYSDRYIHCCFNIYKRNEFELHKKKINKLNDINIIEVRLGNKVITDYDIKLCAWGSSIGKKIKNSDSFAKEFYIKVINKKLSNKILACLENVDWKNEYVMTSTPNLLQWQVFDFLKRNIPEIK